jgi:hypothetical protein
MNTPRLGNAVRTRWMSVRLVWGRVGELSGDGERMRLWGRWMYWKGEGKEADRGVGVLNV